MLMINDSHPPGLDVSSYTIREIDGITSEYTLKNTVSGDQRRPGGLRPAVWALGGVGHRAALSENPSVKGLNLCAEHLSGISI